MSDAYDYAMTNGNDYADLALNVWDSLENQIKHNAPDDVISVYHRRVQTYAALATMEYAKATAISARRSVEKL